MSTHSRFLLAIKLFIVCSPLSLSLFLEFDFNLSVFVVEGSLSSSGKRKKAQESRLVRDEHANLSPQQRNWLLKVEEPVNC